MFLTLTHICPNSGDPRQHIRQYSSLIGMKGLDEKQTLCAFPMSLTRNVLRWYYNLDSSKTKVWNKLGNLFVDQFIFNAMIDVTLKLLSNSSMRHFLSIWWGGRKKFQRWLIGPMKRIRLTWSSRTFFQHTMIGFCCFPLNPRFRITNLGE